jgi:hypothetical protein
MIAIVVITSFYTTVHGGTVFAGLGNYESLISDHVFWRSLGVTLWFNLLVNPIQIAISLGLARVAPQPWLTSTDVLMYDATALRPRAGSLTLGRHAQDLCSALPSDLRQRRLPAGRWMSKTLRRCKRDAHSQPSRRPGKSLA